jgi:hypothetical protein
MRFSVIQDKMNSGKFIAFVKKLLADVGCPIIVIADTLPITPLGQSRLLPKRAREQSRWPIFRAMPRNSIQMNRSGIMLKGGWQSYSSTAKQL